MASTLGVLATANAIKSHLDTSFDDFDDELFEHNKPHVYLVRPEDFGRTGQGAQLSRPAVCIFVYRIEINRATRAGWSAVGHVDGRSHLPLDIHFLISALGKSAEQELGLLGMATGCLEDRPVLASPQLDAKSGFAPGETVQVLFDEVAPDVIMRVFEALSATYRVSLPYLARVVRIDGRAATPAPDVSTVVGGVTPSVESLLGAAS
jgi:hypothetical protein